jgi:hypothetical protein
MPYNAQALVRAGALPMTNLLPMSRYPRAVTSGRRVGGYARLGSYSRRLGQSSLDAALGGSAGAVSNAIVPGSGSVVAPVVDTLAQLFQGNPATGSDAERESKIYSYYATAMTAPGSPSSICAVQTLYSIAMQGQSPSCNGNFMQDNPQATRTYAQEALQVLSSQGWINVNSPNPQYIGVAQSGIVYAPSQTTGQQVAVANAGLPVTTAGITTELAANPLLLIGGGLVLAFVLTRGSSRGSSQAKAA